MGTENCCFKQKSIQDKTPRRWYSQFPLFNFQIRTNRSNSHYLKHRNRLP